VVVFLNRVGECTVVSESYTIAGMSDWFEDGLCFSCTQCGNCCTGPTGAVWFTEHEAIAMASKLEITPDQFYQRYARKIGARWSLTERPFEGKYDCVFLDRSTETIKCSLYNARPSQCRTWPFWSELLKSKKSWELAKKQTPCPGMDTGKLIPASEIRIQRDT